MQQVGNIKSKWMFWCLFGLIFIGEWLLFNRYVARNITHFYPTSFDQASYLPVLYLYFENIKQFGFIKGLSQSPSLATGILFPMQSVLAFIFLGASRHSVLFVNFLYFIALQVVSIFTIKSISSKNHFVYAFLGMLLAVNTPFLIYGGGMFDVRMDFMTFCLYGIFMSTVLLSRCFLYRKSSLLVALVASLAILLRSLTLVYFVGVLGSLFIYLVIKGGNKQRVINLLLVSSLILLATVPLIWLNRDALYNYYLIGHIFGEEKYIRLSEVGVTNRFMALIYYPGMLLWAHLGKVVLMFGALLLFIFLRQKKLPQQLQDWQIGLVFLLAAIFIPMLALTLDVSKSPIVGGIMVVPTLWLLCWIGFARQTEHSRSWLMVASGVLVVGLYCQFHELNHHHSKRRMTELNAISQLYMDVGDYAVRINQPVISIAFDHISEYMTSGGIATLYYETKGKLLNIAVERLGGMIFPITEEEALASLQRADIFVMNLGEYTIRSPYPFDSSVAALRPQLRAYAEKHFKQLGDYRINDMNYRVYVR